MTTPEVLEFVAGLVALVIWPLTILLCTWILTREMRKRR